MSTNKSQNLNLHLWVPEDDFLRTEFNENFAALDTAVKAEENARISAVSAETTSRQTAVSTLQTSINAKASTSALNTAKSELTTKINTAQSAANAAQSTANAAWSTNNRPYSIASITFTPGTTQTVTLGFQPSFVILFGTKSSLFRSSSASAGNCGYMALNSTGFTFNIESGNTGSAMGSSGAYLAWK